jgi:hypothetical protein
MDSNMRENAVGYALFFNIPLHCKILPGKQIISAGILTKLERQTLHKTPQNRLYRTEKFREQI